MRALVSGSTGFSGAFLVAALRAHGFEVSAVSQRASGVQGVERMDLTSSAAWAGALRACEPDHVFHLSGVAHSAILSDFVAQNTAAAAALLDATESAPVPGAVLFVGSATEYGVIPEASLPVVEDFPGSPRIPYGATKFAQTQLALDAVRRGKRVIVARPSNLIGPGMPLFTALGSFARQLRQIELGRRPPVLSVGDLSAHRDFVDVRDVAQVYVALAAESKFAGLVNVSSGAHVAMNWILGELIAAFGVNVTIEQDASRLRAAEVSKFSASRARLDAILGERVWTQLATSLRDMVAHERSLVV